MNAAKSRVVHQSVQKFHLCEYQYHLDCMLHTIYYFKSLTNCRYRISGINFICNVVTNLHYIKKKTYSTEGLKRKLEEWMRVLCQWFSVCVLLELESCVEFTTSSLCYLMTCLIYKINQGRCQSEVQVQE
jgi:hypothetical protein